MRLTLAVDGGLEEVERAGGQHVVGQPGILRALRDANRRFVKHDVDAVHRAPDEIDVADVTVDRA